MIQTLVSYNILSFKGTHTVYFSSSLYIINEKPMIPRMIQTLVSYNILSFKGTHTVYFSSSLYIINQKPMIPRIHFHCITTCMTWVARSSG